MRASARPLDEARREDDEPRRVAGRAANDDAVRLQPPPFWRMIERLLKVDKLNICASLRFHHHVNLWRMPLIYGRCSA